MWHCICYKLQGKHKYLNRKISINSHHSKRLWDKSKAKRIWVLYESKLCSFITANFTLKVSYLGTRWDERINFSWWFSNSIIIDLFNHFLYYQAEKIIHSWKNLLCVRIFRSLLIALLCSTFELNCGKLFFFFERIKSDQRMWMRVC